MMTPLLAFRRHLHPRRTLSINMSPAIATELRVDSFLRADEERISKAITDRELLAGDPEFRALRRAIDGGESKIARTRE
jgi:hypothetical protein